MVQANMNHHQINSLSAALAEKSALLVKNAKRLDDKNKKVLNDILNFYTDDGDRIFNVETDTLNTLKNKVNVFMNENINMLINSTKSSTKLVKLVMSYITWLDSVNNKERYL